MGKVKMEYWNDGRMNEKAVGLKRKTPTSRSQWGKKIIYP